MKGTCIAECELKQRIVDTMNVLHFPDNLVLVSTTAFNRCTRFVDWFKKKHTEADLVNGSVDGEMSRNTWICDDGVYHYCPVCDTLELCKDQEEPLCDFSTFNGTHQLCFYKVS